MDYGPSDRGRTSGHHPLHEACNPEGFVAPVTPGRILFEAEGVPLAVAQEALRLGAQKLPITTKFIVRRDYVETTI